MNQRKSAVPRQNPVLATCKRLVQQTAARFGIDIRSAKQRSYGDDAFFDIERLAAARGRPVEVFFDVGANIGQTCFWAARVFPAARIFAFEPTATTFQELTANVAHLTNVQPCNVALGEQCGTAKLYAYEYSQINSLVPVTHHTHRFAPSATVTECEVTTLDQFCEQQQIDRVDVLKLDTEGHDLAVLHGAQRWLTEGRIDFIYVEFNDIAADPSVTGGALGPMCEFLRPFGFRFIASYTDSVDTQGDYFVVCNALLARSSSEV